MDKSIKFVGVLGVFILWIALAGVSVNAAPPQPVAPPAPETVTKESLDMYKELANAKLEAAKESAQKDVSLLVNRLNQQDRTLAQHSGRIDEFQYKFDVTLIFAVVFLILFAMLISMLYFSIKATSKNDPRDAVRAGFDQSNQRLEQHTAELVKKMELLQADLNRKVNLLSSDQGLGLKVNPEVKNSPLATSELTKQVLELDNYRSTVKPKPSGGSSYSQTVSSFGNSAFANDDFTSKTPLYTVADAQRNVNPRMDTHSSGAKVETMDRFTDLDRRAYAAKESGNKEDAIYYWKKASMADDAMDEQAATCLFNIAAVQAELGRRKESISTFEDMLDRFWSIDSPTIQLLCAKALVKKGELLTVPDLS